MVGQLSGDAVRRYATAGNARFTLRSEKTGERFTFRVRQNEERTCYFVALLTGPDNGADYRYLGFINRQGVFIHGGLKSCASTEAPSFKAFAWFWKNLDALPGSCSVFHEGRCGRCGRALTVPESVASGLGPQCAGRAA